ncbi:MAG TPA: S-methyl-5-thioribose-1-phosphate isomerase [Polyangiaceae bacterium]|nr:S-methyl-5-thioribose-1-phosphate isomerase [Polyangiaceae bacterium]
MNLPHPAPLSGASYSAVELLPDNDALVMLDQRRLPTEEEYLRYHEADAVADAITQMVVRGAPAIGIAAAYAMVLAARASGDFDRVVRAAAERLCRARPTAVNLSWAVQRMLAVCDAVRGGAPADRVEKLAEAARALHAADVAANRRMGALGAERIADGAVVLTHCNAGALATGGYGTALGVIRAARAAGKRVRVLADETRPFLQGSRLTAWELDRDGIDVSVITDASAGSFFARGEIDAVVVGADRVASNGDVANKIGTYALACLAQVHQTPFYVAAPWSTVDPRCPSGREIPIEERSAEEVVRWGQNQLAPSGVSARNPAFDVTPARLIGAIFSERGVIEPVGPEAIQRLDQLGGDLGRPGGTMR